MPSPFPGMDPYIECPDLWPEFHRSLMTYARDTLQQCLPVGYVAHPELRIYFESKPEKLGTEPQLLQREAMRPGTSSLEGAGVEGRTETTIGGYWVQAPGIERREEAIAIRTRNENALVTWIDLLSPNNKRPGVGRARYQEKQAEVLAAGLNLVELDLLRGGSHTVAVDAAWLRADQPRDYMVCKHLSTRVGWFWVRQWSVRDPLPVVEIPLSAGEAAVPLDLGELFTRAYENGRFDRLIRYDVEPEPPLSIEDAMWAAELLGTAGLRGATDA